MDSVKARPICSRLGISLKIFKESHPQIGLSHDKAVEQVTLAKSLGVYINQSLNCECHIEDVCEKIAKVAQTNFASYAL